MPTKLFTCSVKGSIHNDFTVHTDQVSTKRFNFLVLKKCVYSLFELEYYANIVYFTLALIIGM